METIILMKNFCVSLIFDLDTSSVLFPKMFSLSEKLESGVHFILQLGIVHDIVTNILKKSFICCKLFK